MKLLTIALAVLIAAQVACGPKLPPTTAPEAKVAVKATQLVEALRATLPTIKTMTCGPSDTTRVCLKVEDTIKIAANMSKAADIASELGGVLLAANEARDATARTGALQKASGILAAIQNLLTNSILIPQGEEVQAALAATFTTVNALLFSVIWSA